MRCARRCDRGALDCACDSIQEAVNGADAVFVAVPVGLMPRVVGEALDLAAPDCVVTDVGSTKRAVVAGHQDPRFVGGHPLAGAENAGVEHARADLFDDATWYLTPTPSDLGRSVRAPAPVAPRPRRPAGGNRARDP